MRARRLPPAELAALEPEQLIDAVLLASVRVGTRRLAKGTRLDRALAHELIGAAEAGMLDEPLRLGWADDGDLHEDEAAHRLALAVGGAGVTLRPPHLSRIDLATKWDGVLHVRTAVLGAINAIDPLEVFTLYHAQCVVAGDVVASVKVAPHLVPALVVREGVHLARGDGPVVEVRPYRALAVPAIVAEDIGEAQLDRFTAGAATKLEALGSRFAGAVQVWEADPARSAARAQAALERLVLEDRRPLVLVTGVSSGDPLSSFLEALASLGGIVVRHGVPAHPGSMIWIARLGASTLLGLPGCGMFAMATAADLILPRLLTGETLGAAELAELGHGGLLGKQMRYRFPAYARELEAPE